MSNTDDLNKTANKSRVLTIGTEDTAIIANDVIGQLNFRGLKLVNSADKVSNAGISSIAESEFTATNNSSKLSFQTGAGDNAIENMSISSVGNLNISGNLTVTNQLIMGGTDSTYHQDPPSAKISLGSGTGAPSNRTITSSSIVSFDTTDYDTDSKFNTTSYKYTIPYSGKYIVTINFYINYDTNLYGKLSLIKICVGTTDEISLLHSNTWGKGGHNMTGIFNLEKDDVIFVKNAGSNPIEIGTGTKYTTMFISLINFGTSIDSLLKFSNTADKSITIKDSIQSVVGKDLTIKAGATTLGTTNDIGGGNLILEAGAGKGTGAGGDVLFKVYNAGSSGSSLNTTASTAITIKDSGYIGLNNSSPSETLDINGDVNIKEKVVDNSIISGLVGHWKFDGNTDDSSGNNNHAIAIADISNVPNYKGEPNKALIFDGTHDYVTTGNINTGSGGLGITTNRITVSCWAKSNEATGNWSANGCLISKRDGFVLHPNSGNKTIYFMIRDGSTTYFSGTYTMTDIQTWHLYTGTYDGSYVRLYIDSVEVIKTSHSDKTIYNDGGPLRIGVDDYADSSFPDRLFNGVISDVRIYNRALTAAEVYTIYNPPGGDLIVDGLITKRTYDPLVVYYKLDDGSGTSATDSSGNGYTGTINGGATWTTNRYREENKALNFNGVDSFIVNTDAANSSSILFDLSESNFSISLWFNTSVNNSSMLLLAKEYNGSYKDFSIALNSAGKIIFSTENNGNNHGFTGPSYTINQWNHLVTSITLSGTSMTVSMYLNGTLQSGSYSSGSSLTTHNNDTYHQCNLYIGKRHYVGSSAGSFFNGSLADIRIYEIALSSDDIKKLYADSEYYNGIKVDNSGNIGIGLMEPETMLHVNGDIRNSTSVVSFTGSHEIERNNLNNFSNADIGKIVTCKGSYKQDLDIFNCIPICELSGVDNDKCVYGVLSKLNKLTVNAVGEGSMWVCNKNGNLINGDYITSSTVTGYGVKQIVDASTLRNYTVGKITCDCDFTLTKSIKKKVKYIDNINTNIDYDTDGNVQYIDDLDINGLQQQVYKYDTRFIDSSGNLLQDEADYTTRLANSESVFIACFVGCTYHCG